MKIKIILYFSLILFPFFCFAQSFPVFPMAFFGDANLNGSPLTVGSKIRAYCGNELIGEVKIEEVGIYGYNEATKIKLLIGECASDIVFKYLLLEGGQESTGGVVIKYTNGFEAGKVVYKNLNFITVRACDITNGTGSQTWSETSWGSCSVVSCNTGYVQSGSSCVQSSSGGGGGGDGGGNTPVTPTITKAGDANGDNKVDKYDFALMMANWGKTGTNVCDFNNDGKVDKYDFALLMSKWGL